MDGKSNQLSIREVDTVVECAKVLCGITALSREVRQAARNFVKRKKESRSKGAWDFLVAAAQVLTVEPMALLEGMGEHGIPEMINILMDTASEPTPEPAAPAPEPTPEPTPELGARPTSKRARESLELLLAQKEGIHLGDICGFYLGGGSKPVQQVLEAAARWGLSDDFQFPKGSPNGCYRKAIAELFQRGAVDRREYSAVLVEDNEDKIIHSIVCRKIIDKDDEENVSPKDAEFSTDIKVGFNKAAYMKGSSPEACLVLQKAEHPIAREIKRIYLELATTYLTSDLRIGIRAAFKKWDAVNVLPQTGFFFVPNSCAEKVRSWHGFMEDLNQTTAILPQFDTVETIETLRTSTRMGLESQLKEVMDFLEQHASGKVRSSTLQTRVENFDELMARSELYERILGGTLQDLRDKMMSAREGVVKDITSVREREALDKEEAKKAQKEKDKIWRDKKKAEAMAAKEAEEAAKEATPV